MYSTRLVFNFVVFDITRGERCFTPESRVWSEVTGQKIVKAYRYF
jgi:hypothetical protein